MKRTGFFRHLDLPRLRLLLSASFLALAIPAAILSYQSYQQIQWEAFHLQRQLAEALAGQIARGAGEMLAREESRPAAEYRFLVVAGDPSANFLQRSPLSEFPDGARLPGLIGYFEVDESGSLNTPLLPSSDVDPARYGISMAELQRRLGMQAELHQVLSDNHLVQRRQPEPVAGPALNVTDESTGAAQLERLGEYPGSKVSGFRDRQDDRTSAASLAIDADSLVKKTESGLAASQTAFDSLNDARRDSPIDIGEDAGPGLDPGPIADLKLDQRLEQKSRLQEAAKRTASDRIQEQVAADTSVRVRRKEQTVVAVPTQPAADMAPEAREEVTEKESRAPSIIAPAPITAFESEIDPLEFSLLDSGHLVLFRQVLQDGQRLIQGMLLDQEGFLDGLILPSFKGATLARSSNLTVAYEGELLSVFHGDQTAGYTSRSPGMTGTLLYRARLSAPLDRLEMVFSLNTLPAGPGARLITWISVILALLLIGVFFLLYRLGAAQIALAAQQQDFVAAVSHELKTPLTSIRMYGEMLRSGWGDESQQQKYHAHIQQESERLSRLIENVLQMARMTRNDPNFVLVPAPVGDLLASARTLVEAQLERAGFSLQIDIEPGLNDHAVIVDRDCFAQVVINLVDNAIKFAAAAELRTIVIGALRQPAGGVQFRVRDFGPGIPREQRRKIFRLFYRSGHELTRETTGTGIGLALVQQLLLAMGGKIDVVNSDPGAEFRFSLVDA